MLHGTERVPLHPPLLGHVPHVLPHGHGGGSPALKRHHLHGDLEETVQLDRHDRSRTVHGRPGVRGMRQRTCDGGPRGLGGAERGWLHRLQCMERRKKSMARGS